MRVLTILLVAGCVVAAGVARGEGEGEPTWTYAGATGPDHWAELDPEWEACGAGRRQSPIDVGGAAAGDLKPLTFRYRDSLASVTDTGHTVLFSPNASNVLRIGRRAVGTLAQVHFHAGSEHRVAGRTFPLELHLVHHDADEHLTVVGVLVRRGAPNKAATEMLGEMPADHDAPTVFGSIDPAGLLPDRLRSVRYAGSLTTPPCTEGVRWVVLTRPITMSPAQIAAFREHYAENQRPLQALNGRSLLAG